jgi:hypothetical protein
MKILVRRFFFVFAVIVFLVSVVGCQDKRVAPLEQRVGELEVKMKLLETERAKAADAQSQKEFVFKACVQNANDEYFQDVKANGTRTRNGAYDMPVVTAREIDRRKQQKIEECKLLYR